VRETIWHAEALNGEHPFFDPDRRGQDLAPRVSLPIRFSRSKATAGNVKLLLPPRQSRGNSQDIRFQATGFPQRRVTATLVFECTYEGVLSESYHGFMNCVDKTSLPLRLWTK
jgi:hypothetical protein